MTDPLAPPTTLPMDDESTIMLMALADGELSPEDAAPLLARVAADPALADRFAMFVATRAMAREALEAGPVPDRLVQAVLAAPVGAEVIPLRPRPAARLIPMALAASLALAVGIGGFLAGRTAAPGMAGGDPAERAATALAALPTGSEGVFDGGTARVLGSYGTDLGLCRLLDLSIDDGRSERAVVCRGDDGWAVALAVTSGAAESFVPASETAVELVDGLLDRIGAGAALDPVAEAAALAE
ncbi:MAG: hypothetical protein KF887_16875 [Paracoccaceae bacterium]|nr:MAG: hypothetical protein KF887_16875 [Paracoccaceae bacterium]